MLPTSQNSRKFRPYVHLGREVGIPVEVAYAAITEVRLPRSKNVFPNFGTPRSSAVQSTDSYPPAVWEWPIRKVDRPPGTV
jgi:hypothetical protein